MALWPPEVTPAVATLMSGRAFIASINWPTFCQGVEGLTPTTAMLATFRNRCQSLMPALSMPNDW